MITETEISNLLSGSLLGDYTPVIDQVDINAYAIDLFKKIIDVDSNGRATSDLFALSLNQNPRAVYELQKNTINSAISSVTNLKDYGLPNAVKKLPFILDPDTALGINDNVRAALIAERDRLQFLFNSLANVPVVFSTTITD
jgi:hypothetical protein